MSSVARAARPTNGVGARIVPIPVRCDARGRRAVNHDDPAALTRELLLLAVDRFEDARRFAAVVASRAEALGTPETLGTWRTLGRRAAEQVTQAEEALAYLIDSAFNEVAPAWLQITSADEARASPAYLGRGIGASGVAYILRRDVGDVLGPGIITRSALGHLPPPREE